MLKERKFSNEMKHFFIFLFRFVNVSAIDFKYFLFKRKIQLLSGGLFSLDSTEKKSPKFGIVEFFQKKVNT